LSECELDLLVAMRLLLAAPLLAATLFATGCTDDLGLSADTLAPASDAATAEGSAFATRVYYPLTGAAGDAPFRNESGRIEGPRIDGLFVAAPVYHALRTETPAATAILTKAQEILDACSGAAYAVAAQHIAYELLDHYLAGGDLYHTDPSRLAGVRLGEAERRAIAYAVRLLVEGETHHAALVAAALDASGDALPDAERSDLARQTRQRAEAFLAAHPPQPVEGTERVREREQVARGLAALRALER
jgi:hypothetical protein